MLIHAINKWPSLVTPNLWPYAIRMANDALNNSPNLKDPAKRTPFQAFTGTSVNINPKHWKPFGCPAAVLEEPLANGKPFHKWKHRAKMGVYLGLSPLHAKNVSLVLSRTTGYVSPQFHVKYDAHFTTTRENDTVSEWQLKCGFIQQPSPQLRKD